MTQAKVRALEAHEWELLRSLRLRALEDAPDAFGPTHADAASKPDGYWQKAAADLAAARAAELFVAELGDDAVGLVSATRVRRVGRIGAMWVAPQARGAGLARRLLEAACDALEGFGCERLSLSVTETNEKAIALYRKFGFESTGEAHPLREGSPLRELEMARPVASPLTPADA